MGVANSIHMPTQTEIEEAEASSKTLSKYADMDRVKLSIEGENGQTDSIVLPGDTAQLLLALLTEISKGHGISLLPHHQELGTQEAANLLSVSRPYLVGLLERGAIPFHRVGSHRRVLLKDVLKYKGNNLRLRKEPLNQLTQLSQDEGMGYPQ